jgi:hypothetical protein
LVFPLWMMALIWAYSGAVIGSMYRSPEPDHKEPSDQNEDSASIVEEKG